MNKANRLCASALVALALAPTFASADTSENYVGCLSPGGTITRVGLGVPLGGACRPNQTEITLGGTGSGTVRDVEYVEAQGAAANVIARAEAQCPEGKKVIGGGGFANPADVSMNTSAPTEDYDGWEVIVRGREPELVAATAYAICATLD